MHVWLNGKFVSRVDARISAFDAGFQHGVGLFETMRARNGQVFRAERHLERLAVSATNLRLTEQLLPTPLIQAVADTVARNELRDARVRLTLTGGDLNMLQATGRGVNDPTILIVAQPPTQYPDTFFTEGVRVVIADGRVNPFDAFAGHKTLSYWSRIHALQAASAIPGCGEALWFTVNNHLAGGSVSNVFLVQDGELRTPLARGEEPEGAAPAPVLPGITRATIIELAAARGIPVERCVIGIDDLLRADEVFLTNSSWGILPVIGVERQAVGSGSVGEVAIGLRGELFKLIDAETGD